MANLIKGQVLKHLSKFFKNLSMDSLNLSTMKGQCDFYNLELNEEVLMDILEFPVWLNLTKATCNHVVIKIPWTKLKSLPIQFFLDEVFVLVETCETFRTHKNDSPTHSTSAPRKYGYAERLIDGIQITINSVVANFKSYEFFATFQLSQLVVESRNPSFKQCNDLRLTKIKDENRGQILTFKHIEWQAFKLEAKSEATSNSTPLRLITGSGRFLLTIKKNLSDCQVVSARIVFIFDDIRWVLTDAMLLSAFHLVTYLNNLMNKAPITKKSVEDVTPTRSPVGNTPVESSSQSQANETPIGRYFSNFDVVETSYHLVMSTLELYVCDDLKPETGRSSYPPLVSGGCLHVIITQLVIDTYPYHKCLGSRNHWYKSALPNELNFVSQHIHAFADKMKSKESSNAANVDQLLKGLLSMAMVIRVSKYKVEVVSTNTGSGKGRKLDSNQKRDLLKNNILPDDMPSVYLEVNRFYYYEVGTNKATALKKAPQPTSYLQIAPFQFLFDPLTLIWGNAFYSNLHKAIVELKSLLPASEADVTMHSRIELFMPTFIFDLAEGTEIVTNNTSFHSLEAKCTKITLTNNFNDPLNFGNINNLLENMANSSLFIEKDDYPWMNDVDASPISNEFMSLLKKLDSLGSVYLNNLWILTCDPFWIEFRQQKTMKVDSLVDPIQISAWIFAADETVKESSGHSQEKEASTYLMLNICSPVKVFIDHDKFLFLMRLFEQMDKFNDYVANDTLRITREDCDSSDFTTVSVASVISDIEVILALNKEWSRMRSVGTSLCASPAILTPIKETSFSQNDDAIKNCGVRDKTVDTTFLPQSKLMSKSESDTLLVANLSVSYSKDEQKHPLQAFHKPLTATSQKCLAKSNHEIFRRSGSHSTLVSETPSSEMSLYEDDNRSMRSDLSGDSDLCLLNGLEIGNEENDLSFMKGNQQTLIEEAVDLSQCSEIASVDSPVSVSFLVVEIPNLSFVKQSHGYLSSTLVDCNKISLREFRKLPFDEYKNYISKCKKTSEDSLSSSVNESKLSLRVDSFSKPGSKSDFLSLLLNNLHVELDADSVQELTDFITDPDAIEVKPMYALLQNCSLKLIDLKVKTPPTVVKMNELAVNKDCDNVLTLVPKVSGDSRKLLLSPHVDLLKRHLKKNLTSFDDSEKSNEEVLNEVLLQNEKLSSEIKRLREENQYLQSLQKNKQNAVK